MLHDNVLTINSCLIFVGKVQFPLFLEKVNIKNISKNILEKGKLNDY